MGRERDKEDQETEGAKGILKTERIGIEGEILKTERQNTKKQKERKNAKRKKEGRMRQKETQKKRRKIKKRKDRQKITKRKTGRCVTWRHNLATEYQEGEDGLPRNAVER
jgi:hypothetical protein